MWILINDRNSFQVFLSGTTYGVESNRWHGGIYSYMYWNNHTRLKVLNIEPYFFSWITFSNNLMPCCTEKQISRRNYLLLKLSRMWRVNGKKDPICSLIVRLPRKYVKYNRVSPNKKLGTRRLANYWALNSAHPTGRRHIIIYLWRGPGQYSLATPMENARAQFCGDCGTVMCV